jgi:hypothetical protein
MLLLHKAAVDPDKLLIRALSPEGPNRSKEASSFLGNLFQ